MHTLKDYVKFVSSSMEIELSDKELYEVVKWLLLNDKYSELLNELASKIIDVKNREAEDINVYKSYKNRGFRD